MHPDPTLGGIHQQLLLLARGLGLLPDGCQLRHLNRLLGYNLGLGSPNLQLTFLSQYIQWIKSEVGVYLGQVTGEDET